MQRKEEVDRRWTGPGPGLTTCAADSADTERIRAPTVHTCPTTVGSRGKLRNAFERP